MYCTALSWPIFRFRDEGSQIPEDDLQSSTAASAVVSSLMAHMLDPMQATSMQVMQDTHNSSHIGTDTPVRCIRWEGAAEGEEGGGGRAVAPVFLSSRMLASTSGKPVWPSFHL